MAKNPARVAAGKAAWRKRMAGKGGSKKGGAKSKASTGTSSNKPKRISLSKVAVVSGGVLVITGWGADRVQAFVDSLNDFLSLVDMGPVPAVAIPAFAVGAVAVGAAWPWFRNKWNNFLAHWGLRA